MASNNSPTANSNERVCRSFARWTKLPKLLGDFEREESDARTQNETGPSCVKQLLPTRPFGRLAQMPTHKRDEPGTAEQQHPPINHNKHRGDGTIDRVDSEKMNEFLTSCGSRRPESPRPARRKYGNSAQQASLGDHAKRLRPRAVASGLGKNSSQESNDRRRVWLAVATRCRCRGTPFGSPNGRTPPSVAGVSEAGSSMGAMPSTNRAKWFLKSMPESTRTALLDATEANSPGN